MELPYPVVLASASPRRRDLLSRLVSEFEVDTADVDESPIAGETPWQTAERLAVMKAEVVAARSPESLVISGDTVVTAVEDGQYVLLGKPVDEQDAIRILRQLSGKDHLVVTGVCLLWPQGRGTFSVTTTVWFRSLSEEEIKQYVGTGEPMDKAGAYAIQGGARGFVERYEGSLTNVIGFPVKEIESNLRKFAGG